MREGKNGSKTTCCRVAEVVMGDSRCMGMSLQGSVKGVQYCGRLRILQDDRERGQENGGPKVCIALYSSSGKEAGKGTSTCYTFFIMPVIKLK